MPKTQQCRLCDKPSIPGVVRGHGKCQYHWNAGVWGKKWADEVQKRKTMHNQQTKGRVQGSSTRWKERTGTKMISTTKTATTPRQTTKRDKMNAAFDEQVEKMRRAETHRFIDEAPINGLCDECGSSVQFHAQPPEHDVGLGGERQAEPAAREGRDDLRLTYEVYDNKHGLFEGNLLVAVVGECVARSEQARELAQTIKTRVNTHTQLVAALESVRAWLIAPATDETTINQMRAVVNDALRLAKTGSEEGARNSVDNGYDAKYTAER